MNLHSKGLYPHYGESASADRASPANFGYDFIVSRSALQCLTDPVTALRGMVRSLNDEKALSGRADSPANGAVLSLKRRFGSFIRPRGTSRDARLMSVALDISPQSSKAGDDKIQARYEEPLRRVEAAAVRRWFPPGSRVLEIGGGTGYQASIIASWGCEIESIDIVCPQANLRYHPVRVYDGLHFPFGDADFDVIYSSNVLDDIPSEHLPLIFAEMHRVLRPSHSRAIHILPSTCWRLAALIGHYPAMIRYAWRYLVADKEAGTARRGQLQGSLSFKEQSEAARLLGLIQRNLINPPQSAYSNGITELYYFSRTYWTKLFREARFEVVYTGGNSLFYTGHALLPTMSLKRRIQVATLLGSACNVFVMRPAESKT